MSKRTYQLILCVVCILLFAVGVIYQFKNILL